MAKTMTDREKDEMLDLAWGIIANASGGDWDLQSPEWREAAERWRDRYHTPTMHDAPAEPTGYTSRRDWQTKLAEPLVGDAPHGTLKITGLGHKIHPHLSDQGKRDLRENAHTGWTDDMVVIARTYDEPPTDALLHVLAMDLSGAVETLRTCQTHPMRADGLLATFMGIPLTGGRYVVTCYARVLGSDVPAARAWLRETLLRTCRVRVVEQGEIPPVGR